MFNFDMVQKLLPDAFTIAILAAIESLLSCVVADGMINSKHRSNTELVAQGAGNIVSALFGGILPQVPLPVQQPISRMADVHRLQVWFMQLYFC